MNSPGDLWAISSYFNPARYRRRLANYRCFRQRLPIPLVTVELSFGADFELRPEDADILLQLKGQDVLWQKERLLNVALGALPSDCRKVLWIDGDVVVEADDWPRRVSEALDRFPVVQPYSHVHHLGPPSTVPDPGCAEKIISSEPSVAFAVSQGRQAQNWEPSESARGAGGTSTGVMWGARRALLDAHGIFDGSIVGGADRAIACAAYGCFDVVMRRHAMNERQQEYYLAWAEPFFAAVRGAVTYVDIPVFHLWHGDLADRRYRERHAGLGPFHFDPFHDIAHADNGAWRWNSAKPRLHEYVRAYIESRKEDG